MEEKVIKLEQEVSSLKATIVELEKKLDEYINGDGFTGVYLDGCPDYAKDYIKKDSKDKEGE